MSENIRHERWINYDKYYHNKVLNQYKTILLKDIKYIKDYNGYLFKINNASKELILGQFINPFYQTGTIAQYIWNTAYAINNYKYAIKNQSFPKVKIIGTNFITKVNKIMATHPNIGVIIIDDNTTYWHFLNDEYSNPKLKDIQYIRDNASVVIWGKTRFMDENKYYKMRQKSKMKYVPIKLSMCMMIYSVTILIRVL